MYLFSHEKVIGSQRKQVNINFPLTSIQCLGVKTTVNTFQTKSKTNYT